MDSEATVSTKAAREEMMGTLVAATQTMGSNAPAFTMYL